MDSKPNILIVSCSKTEPESIINTLAKYAKITKSNDIHTWSIDTKYYTAAVNVHYVHHNGNTDQLEGVEAIVIHFDSDKDNGLEDLIKWKQFVEINRPEIKILIADALNTTTKITKRRAIGWCLENGFELIELNPVPNDDDDAENTSEDVVKEKVGAERVIEALETHMWSNLVMKSKIHEYTKSDSEPIDPTVSTSIDRMLDTLMLDDSSLEFGELFQRLHSMKESVQSMSVRERRHCAEQVVAAFWHAIGGDEDEIENI